MRKLFKWFGVNWLTIASAIAFFVALGLAVLDRTASASLVAAMFLVAALLQALPKMKSIKAFMVEAEFEQTIQTAQNMIEEIRASSLSLATATCSFAATSAGLAWRERFNIVVPITDSLRALGEAEDKIFISARPLSILIANGLLESIIHLLHMKLGEKHLIHEKAVDFARLTFGENSTEHQAAQHDAREFWLFRNPARVQQIDFAADFDRNLDRLLKHKDLSIEQLRHAVHFQKKLNEAFARYLVDPASRKFVIDFLVLDDGATVDTKPLSRQVFG